MELIIIGTGKHADVIKDTYELLNKKFKGFVSYNFYKNDKKEKYLCDLSELKNNEKYNYIIGIGDNYLRNEIYKKYSNLNYINIIHPHTFISKNVNIGKGNYISANVTILTETIIGNHNIINTKTSIDHLNIIGDFNHIAPNSTLCGNINIKNKILIGASTTILPNIIINESIIGANSLIIKDIIKKGIYFGSPCKFIKLI